MSLEESIIYVVDNFGPIKSNDLIVRIYEEYRDQIENPDIPQTINKLVRNGDIIEVEYVLPQMEYRIKSIYFPKGTTFPKE
jgi:hypothetical protein